MSDPSIARAADEPSELDQLLLGRDPGPDCLDERIERDWRQESDDLDRALQEAEADEYATEPGPVVLTDGRVEWPLASLAARALREAFEHYQQNLHRIYGVRGDVRGWSYWAARDLRDLLNGLLERPGRWRQVALDVGQVNPDAEAADAEGEA